MIDYVYHSFIIANIIIRFIFNLYGNCSDIQKKFITFLWIIFTTLKTLKFNYCKTLDY